MTTNTAKIIAKDLEMRFEDKHLFSASKLVFEQNRVIHLQGDNGCGKTTLMKLLAGFNQPTKGKIYAEGFAIAPWWRSNSITGKALYLHQHPYLFEGSVLYNLTYPQRFLTADKAQLQARTEQAIDKAQLRRLLNQAASSLSGGEKQRLAIARAWIIQPKLLMLDEPTSNMDKHSQHLVLQMITDLKQQGTGMLISSHQTCMLTKVCDHAWLVSDKTITTDNVSTLKDTEPTQVELAPALQVSAG
ncbi:ABC transporter ATP-binding protein [Shewanella fidelis]|uniref:Energy-coupling factor ABC transporter ATP-binding protein n=1 Tax=Shewanella fidelis TaxID=173509 RepID=A0AAW8NUX6_9GAMM|nr:energy-coupling factor ABC transporter ATP-binding protein [Shewanella fidelis]MDR8525709.1 energy-coupling factor ABC transporter ATP-binding protein [Shewanella fidelis]MDW4812782.1 energy-coupling factor ABC transporter ATP-binding protein [Shewanella fidelis]MDW4816530.1 energy-coupling factor ABC transporter ATP-binding protein [Shewanella fidelis]MDW4820306.1 energy-coupling factor ABC transporter ATP-binding protein [Shewanella fidelis]MDW4825246.1 energy-coupling factor ABC transpor